MEIDRTKKRGGQANTNPNANANTNLNATVNSSTVLYTNMNEQ